jgi:uncharacterized protein (TIGR02271 family)
MALVKLENFYPNYREDYSDTDNIDIKNFDVYTLDQNKVGNVEGILVDELTGRFRYFIVDTGFWIFGKKVLMPVGLGVVDYDQKRVYAQGLTKDQIENLPNYENLEKVDFDYEEQLRGTYRPMATTGGVTETETQAYNRDSYNYDQEPALYNLNESNNQNLKLYEERLVANKQRQKTGEVTIGKHVETQTDRVAVPLEKERVVIERTSPSNPQPTSVGDANFREGEVARMDIYEEQADIHKEAVVREEVNVKKVVDRDTATAEETLRREELDVDAQGRRVEER